MSKKKLLIIVLVAASLLVGVFYYLNFRSSLINNRSYSDADPLRGLMDPKNRRILEENDSITQKAINGRNYGLCKKSRKYFEVDIPISKRYAMDKCYAAYAIALKNDQVCELIDNSGLRSSCFFKIADATSSLSFAVCEKVKGDSWYFAECIANIAQEAGDISICDKYFEEYTGDWNKCASGLH